MTDSLEADIERFPETAQGWEALGARLAASRDLLADGLGDGWRFGRLATEIGVQHDAFVQSMYDALEQGASRSRRIGELLRAVARDFGLTDAEQQAHLDGLRGEVLGA